MDHTLVFLFKQWRHLLWPGDLGRIRRNLKHWSERISSHLGAPVLCFSFIDGTSRRMCEPGGKSIIQESCYDGHHRFHAIAFQALVAPDGMFIHAYGPFTGNRSDQYILSQSNLLEMAENGEFTDEEGNQYFFFGDLGYTSGIGILSGFKEATGVFKSFNHIWSNQRIAVEWGFGAITRAWQSLDFVTLQKPRRSRIGMWYLVSMILTNCHMCLHRSQASQYFDCQPPSLDEYLVEWNEDFASWHNKYLPSKWAFTLPEERSREDGEELWTDDDEDEVEHQQQGMSI